MISILKCIKKIIKINKYYNKKQRELNNTNKGFFNFFLRIFTFNIKHECNKKPFYEFSFFDTSDYNSLILFGFYGWKIVIKELFFIRLCEHKFYDNTDLIIDIGVFDIVLSKDYNLLKLLPIYICLNIEKYNSVDTSLFSILLKIKDKIIGDFKILFISFSWLLRLRLK